jgi:hypothetical protein
MNPASTVKTPSDEITFISTPPPPSAKECQRLLQHDRRPFSLVHNGEKRHPNLF